MNCQCCNKQKSRLAARDSELIPGNKIILCPDCRRMGHEPRYFIIIASQSGKQIRDFVVNSRYCGGALSAQEVVV